MSNEWLVEEYEPGWFGRLISPHGGGRPGTAAFMVGAAAAVAFALSLAFDWGTVTATQQPPPSEGVFQATDTVLAFGTDRPSLTIVYMIGMVALLGIVGAVVTLPELALKLRLATIGVTAGMVAIVVAGTVQLWSVDDAKAAVGAGLFFAYAAALLPAAAVWLAARPAAQVAPAPRAVVVTTLEEEASEAPVAPLPRGLSVSGGPVDLTVTPG
jgi:hypothetical protein